MSELLVTPTTHPSPDARQRRLVRALGDRLRATGLRVGPAEYAGAPALEVLGQDGSALVVAPLFRWALGEHVDSDGDVWEVALRGPGGDLVPIPGSEVPWGCPSIWDVRTVGTDLAAGQRFVTDALALVRDGAGFRPASMPMRVANFPALPYPGARPATSYVQTADDEVFPVHVDAAQPSGFTVDAPGGPVCLDAWLTAQGTAPLAERLALLSYGSNACPEKTRANGVSLPAVTLRCSVDDLVAVWCSGTRQDGAVPATLAHRPGHREDHFLSYVLPRDIRVLDAVEGRPGCYDLMLLTRGRVIREDGVTVPEVAAYVGTGRGRWPLRDRSGHPVAVAGTSQAEASALLAEGSAALRPSPVGASVPDGAPTVTGVHHLLVYGTLLPDEPRWPLLAPFLATDGDPEPALVSGALYDTGNGYPALFEGTASVPGYVIPLAPALTARALAVLDVVEGTGTGLFARELVRVGGTLAWVYRGLDPALRCTPIAGWACHNPDPFAERF